jgi:hypothetical protein
VQPLLGALGFLSIRIDFGLQLRNTILGGAKLVREPLCGLDRLSAISVGDIGGFAKQLKDRFAGHCHRVCLEPSVRTVSPRDSFFDAFPL